MAQLPFDYQKIGPKRYARTWSIRNLYENYRERRDRFLAAPRGGEGYFEELYALNRGPDLPSVLRRRFGISDG